MVTADDIIDQLKQVGFAEVEGRAIRPADKVAALDKMAKVLGLYRDGRSDRDQRPVVTQVTVVLNHGRGGTATETQRVVDRVTPVPPAPRQGLWNLMGGHRPSSSSAPY